MTTQADKLKELMRSVDNRRGNTKFIAITSGKGGVGKSTVTANLGYMLHELGFKVALFDADIGLANLDVILKVSVKKNILHVLKGEVEFKDIIVEVKDGFYLIPGDSGDEIFKYSDEQLFNRFIEDLNILNDVDFLIIDTGAGISKEVQTFLNAADEVIVVTAPEPAAITDAYAMVKILYEKRERVFMILNQVAGEKDATNIFAKVLNVAKANIDKNIKLQMIGFLKKDPIISKGNIQRFLFAEKYPNSAVTLSLKNIAKKTAQILERKVLNDEEKGLGRFFKKILGHF